MGYTFWVQRAEMAFVRALAEERRGRLSFASEWLHYALYCERRGRSA